MIKKERDEDEILNEDEEGNEGNTSNKPTRTSNEQHSDLYSTLKRLLSTYIYLDFEPFYPLVNSLFNKMLNWELMGEQEIKVLI